MSKFVDRNDEEVSRLASQLVAAIVTQIDEHLASKRAADPTDRPVSPRGGARVHRMPTQYTTVFTAPVNAPVHIGGSPEPDVVLVQRALTHVLERLPEAGLPQRVERDIRRTTTAALDEAERLVQPQRGQLRRLLGQVSTALITGAASGGANPVVQELVRGLQHVMI
ncbi:hypothetical protein [Saccharopolyspora shandongensis]|uniref:hypothetical protein n=1 Tax=Saccharopolyspora shandongensis TaxID=418495 RepID=UPI0033D96F11